MMTKRIWCALFVMTACGDDGRLRMVEGTSAADLQAQWAALEVQVGCTPTGEEFPSDVLSCPSEYSAWLTCVAQDLTQCYCEQSDDDLNCEGSFKANEGPALCIPEFIAAYECSVQAQVDELNMRWSDLAGAAACGVREDSLWTPENLSQCGDVASDWLTCVAGDPSQCRCDNGTFRCDGSFDPAQGPALCTTAYDSLERCQELFCPEC